MSGVDVGSIASSFVKKYKETHSREVMLIDMVLVFTFATGVLQFLYMALVGTYPYNSFLAGFFSSLGLFISAACLRMQICDPSDFERIPREQAFADFVVFNVILNFVVVTFMG